MTRDFERDAAIETSTCKFNDVFLASCPNPNKIQTSLKMVDGMEIFVHLGHILLFKLISPIVAEIFRGKLLQYCFGGFEFGIMIVITPITDKGGKKFRGI